MKYTVYRLSKSSYQDAQFIAREKKAIEEVVRNTYISVTYTEKPTEIDPDSKIILLTNSHSCMDEIPKVLVDKIELIIHPNSGHDNYSKDFLDQFKGPIIVGNQIRANAVAEYILSCLFHHFCPIPNHHHWDEKREWDRVLLSDQKIIIYGHGHIGSKVYASLKPIIPNLYVIDPKHFHSNLGKKVNQVSDEILNKANIVIICTDLNDSSLHLIDNDLLGKLDESFLIINAARGKNIDIESLKNWLKKYPKAMAYIDVFDKEPYAPGFLVGLKNLNKTSHIAGVFDVLNQRMIEFEKSILSDFLSTESDFATKYKKLNIGSAQYLAVDNANE
jgi:D-3-phosphoglycerate dehydrogenase